MSSYKDIRVQIGLALELLKKSDEFKAEANEILQSISKSCRVAKNGEHVKMLTSQSGLTLEQQIKLSSKLRKNLK